MLISDQFPPKKSVTTNTLEDWQKVSLQTFHKGDDALRCIVWYQVSFGETKSNKSANTNDRGQKKITVSNRCKTSGFIDVVPGLVLRPRDCFWVRMSYKTLQPVNRLDLEPHSGGFRVKAVCSCKIDHMTERRQVFDSKKSICDFMRLQDQKKQVGQVVAL